MDDKKRKKTPKNQLSLNKKSIRKLSKRELQGVVAGGMPDVQDDVITASCGCDCPSATTSAHTCA
jgi:hypothetical protein